MTKTEYILSIDPGISTGIALISYEPDGIPVLAGAWQFTGGLTGFLKWVPGAMLLDPGVNGLPVDTRYMRTPIQEVTIVAEKFQPISHSNYALTTASVEPLRIEGAMVALGMMPDYTVEEKRWRRPIDQYVTGGKTKADKKKRMHQALKDLGFYRTGKDFGTADADDFRSACAHGLAYLLKVVKHKPTYELLQRGH